MQFSERLIILRKSHHLTQKQLAAEIQLSELAIQHYESQRRKPAFDALIALADFFDVSIDYLAGRTDKPEINK
jgi:transcriptional regulator with XRE-family HTH domain